MKPMIHAKASAKKYGGMFSDYIEIHKFLDSSKAALPDIRHRAVFHSAFGIFVAERVFGDTITNSDGKDISVRSIAEDHVLEDLGFIPTLEKWLATLPIEDWMMGSLRNQRKASQELLGHDETDLEGQDPVEEEPVPASAVPASAVAEAIRKAAETAKPFIHPGVPARVFDDSSLDPFRGRDLGSIVVD